MQACLDFLQHVYGVFGFTFQLKLSTRPENYLGEISVWDEAEEVKYLLCFSLCHANCAFWHRIRVLITWTNTVKLIINKCNIYKKIVRQPAVFSSYK